MIKERPVSVPLTAPGVLLFIQGRLQAHSLLATASIAVAIGSYVIAVGVTLPSLFVLHTLRKLECSAKPRT